MGRSSGKEPRPAEMLTKIKGEHRLDDARRKQWLTIEDV